MKRFDKHQESIRGFNDSAKGFVNFIDSLRDNKQAAQQERAYVTTTKAEMLQDLDSVLETEFDERSPECFCTDRVKSRPSLAGPAGVYGQSGSPSAQSRECTELSTSIRSYAQMLRSDIEKADRGWVDARKENIVELRVS